MEKYDGWFVYQRKHYKQYLVLRKSILKRAKEYNANINILIAEDFKLQFGNPTKLFYKNEEVTNFPNFIYLNSPNFELLKYLEDNGVRIINNLDRRGITSNKLATYELLATNNIPIPKTFYYSAGYVTYEKVKSDLGPVFISKEKRGAKGKTVNLIKCEEDFKKLKNKKERLYQEFITTSNGSDLRVTVLGGKILGAINKKATKEGEFRTHMLYGGEVNEYKVDQKLKAIAQKTYNVIGLDLIGIDILFTEDGYCICEVNSNPGLGTLKYIKGVVFTKELFEFLQKNKYLKENK